MTSQHTLKPTTILQNYEIIKVLGAGGFGITYKAKDLKKNRTVVIKEYFPSQLAIRSMDDSILSKTDADGEFQRGLQRFKEEAKTLVNFNHKTIVKIIDYFEMNNTAYFVMRDEGGMDLEAYMKQLSAPLSQDEILEIIMPILEGLKEVHAYNYLHRDIKPANILLRRGNMPVLIDFGASKVALGDDNKNLTLIFSPGYAPFEQYSSDSKVQGAFSDLYSLAAVVYKMITGSIPAPSLTRINEITAGNKDPYVPLQYQNLPQYEQSFLQTIDATLSLDAKYRPQTVQEFQAQVLGHSKSVSSSQETEYIQQNTVPIEPPGLFSFDGRINRLKYWLQSFIPIIMMFASVIPVIVSSRDGGTVNPVISIFFVGAILFSVWLSLAIQVKRWHDLDQSGWWSLIGFVPYVNIVVFIILGFVKGTEGPNRFGQDPLGTFMGNVASAREPSPPVSSVHMPPSNSIVSNGNSVTLLGIGSAVPSIVLSEDKETTVGRSSNADIKINNQYVSGTHVALSVNANGNVQVRDLSSSNGTYINGKKLEANKIYELKQGERLLIASEDVVYTV